MRSLWLPRTAVLGGASVTVQPHTHLCKNSNNPRPPTCRWNAVFSRPIIGPAKSPKMKMMCSVVATQELELERSEDFRVTQITPPLEMSDYYSASVLASKEVARDCRCIIVEAEVSRELVQREHTYTSPGQLARVRVGDEVCKVPVCSAPFPRDANFSVLYKMRGDMPHGFVKPLKSTLSVRAPLHLHVPKQNFPLLYHLNSGDKVEVGPFATKGVDLKPLLFVSGFPKLVFFGSGKGIAVVKAIVDAKEGDPGSVNLEFRQEARLYYSAPDPSFVAYKDKFEEWEEKNVGVRTTVKSDAGMEWEGCVGPFSSLWEEDDLEYEAKRSAAVICAEPQDLEELEDVVAAAGIPESNVALWDAFYFLSD